MQNPVRALGRLLGMRPGMVGGAAACATAASALALVPFFVVARMAGAVYATPPRLAEMRTLALVGLAAVALRYVLLAGANMLAHVAAFRILHDLRLRLAAKLSGVPLSFFADHPAGHLKRTLVDDVNQVESFVAHNFPDAVAAAVVPLATAIALLWVDWRMALASIAVAPLAVLAMAIAMRDVGKAHAQWFAIQDRMNVSLLEYLRGIHVIKTFGLTAERFGDLARSIEEGLTWMEGFMRTNGRGYGVFAALIGSSLVILVPAGGWFFVQRTLSLDALVLFLVLGPQLLMSMLRLVFAWGNVDRIKQGNERIRAVLDAPDFGEVYGGAEPADATVTFHDVGFEYAQGRTVLERVSFTAEAGKVTALVGPSGAGKTTAMRLLPRFWDATSGTISVGGVDIRSLRLDALLSRIAMVFQDVFLFHGTVRDNLRLGRPDATDEELEAACRAAQAHDFIRALPEGYETKIGERGARLSGGEKQRLSIARALLKDAPILLLDEATAFADPENEARIQDGLTRLCRGRTVIVVAHRLSTIAAADHIVVLDHGKVVDQGPHDALRERCALYRDLWKSHQSAMDWTLAGAR